MLGAMPGTMSGAMSEGYVKENWPAIAAMIKTHYLDPANTGFYVPDRLPMPRPNREFDNALLQQIEPRTGGGTSIIVSVLGSSSAFGGVSYGFSINVKYDLDLRDSRPVIAGF